MDSNKIGLFIALTGIVYLGLSGFAKMIADLCKLIWDGIKMARATVYTLDDEDMEAMRKHDNKNTLAIFWEDLAIKYGYSRNSYASINVRDRKLVVFK